MTGQHISIRARVTDGLLLLCAAMLYAFLARALLTSFPTMDFTGIFHPWIGIAFALLLRDLRRHLPGVLLGTILVHLITTQSLLAALPIGLGATLATACGTWLMTRHTAFDARRFSLKNYLHILIFGGGVAAAISTLIRATILLLGGALQRDQFSPYLLHWWMGDALGIALLTPLLIVLQTDKIKSLSKKRLGETALLLALCGIAGQIIFVGRFSSLVSSTYPPYWMFLFVAWAAIRLGTAGTALVLIITAIQASYGLYLKTGFLASDLAATGLTNYSFYLMILSLVGMSLATHADDRVRAEEDLREREQLMSAAMEILHVGLFVISKDGHLQSANQTARHLMERLQGATEKAFGGVRAWRYGTTHELAPDEWAGSRALAHGETSTGEELEMACVNGDRLVLLNAARPILDKQGKISKAVIAVTDITERKHQEALLHGESLETLAQRDNALKEITQGVAIANADRIVTYVNDAFVSHTGFGREEVIGQSCKILQGPDTDPLTLERIRTQLNATLPFQGEILNYRKDGTAFWNDLSITPVFNDDGELTQWVGIQRDVTEKKQALAQIARLNQIYAALSHCNTSIVHCKTRQELFDQICEGVVQYGGMRMAWIGMIDEAKHALTPMARYGTGTDFLEALGNDLGLDDPSGFPLTLAAVTQGTPVWCQDLLNDPAMASRRDQAIQSGFRAMAALPLSCGGKVVGNFSLYADTVNAFDQEARDLLLEMAQDISFALDNFERQQQIELAANIFAQSNESVVVANADRKIVMVNHAFTAMTSHASEDVLGKNMRGLYTGFRNEATFKTIIETLDQHGRWQGEIWNRKKNGEPYLEWLSVSLVRNAEGSITHYVCTSTDITQRKQDEERMHWLAHFDTLTGLPNRALLEDRCKQALRIAQSGQDTMALMILDIDNFKTINDAIGLHSGDILLSELADRFSFIVREHDTLSRVGGDEFVFALPGLDADSAAHLAEKIMGTVARPFLIDNHELIITASIGIAMFPTDGQEYTELMTSADLAMSRAKLDGRNAFRFFTPEIQARSMRRLQLENALRRALERDQMCLHYQPQVSVQTQAIVGAEALLRWEHPEFGMVTPSEFIPIAESSGMILPIGEWAMRTAARQLKNWIDAGHPPFTVSVNLSAAQFRHPKLPDLVMSVLKEASLPPEHFELELTESVAMENPGAAIAVMDQLHAHGIRMSIDDFGTGYSSLAHLKRFKVYKLKIDRSFVNDITTDPEDRAIVGAVISLAQNLGLKTTAEGVENADQLAYIRNMGCDEIQGYYFSRPLSANDFGKFLSDRAGRT